MNRAKTAALTITCALTAVLASGLGACCSQPTAGNAGSAQQLGDFASLEPFKQLAGTWQADEDGDGKPDMTLVYTTIGAGSAVMEHLFPGTPHQMVTVYHTHYGQLRATHYCAAKNQPAMVGTWDSAGTTCTFDYLSATNAAADSTVMGHMKYVWQPDGTLKTSWGSVKAGKVVGEPHGGVFKKVS